MSSEGALVEELKRLVLENERLKGMLVLMDQERSMPAKIEAFAEKRGFMSYDVATATVDLPELAAMGRGDALSLIHREGVKRLLNEMFARRIATWGSPMVRESTVLGGAWQVHAAFVVMP